MAQRRLNHLERERIVLDDLKVSFPDAPISRLSWSALPEGDDPPDFISEESNARVGLEFVEWLDGDQMRFAKNREKQREEIQRVLRNDWESFQPEHFTRAFVLPSSNKIRKSDERQLQLEFYECSADVDRNWVTYVGGLQHFYRTDFEPYPRLKKFISSVRYIGGKNEGTCWIGMQGDGGAFDPLRPAEVLKERLNEKLTDYSSQKKQEHLREHALSKLFLLIHGGFNAFAYNTPSGPSLENVAASAASFCAHHPNRDLFTGIWFFNSLSSSEEAFRNPRSTHGRSRFLAQLWPRLSIANS